VYDEVTGKWEVVASCASFGGGIIYGCMCRLDLKLEDGKLYNGHSGHYIE
jgi:hypothetical protein